MRTLAIDLGTRRVGLALSDEGARFATPYQVLEVRSPRDAIDQIKKVIKQEDVKRLLIGVPLDMDAGTIGNAAREALDWGKLLEDEVQLPAIYVDERLSSFEAEQQLTDRKRAGEKLSRQAKKSRLDAIVAANLLQQFLDGKAQVIDAPR